MVERRDVAFEVEGRECLRGWLFVPEQPSAPLPVISMAHGYAGVTEHGLERFARAFAEAGFVVLVHDHRNFGASDGATIAGRHFAPYLEQFASASGAALAWFRQYLEHVP